MSFLNDTNLPSVTPPGRAENFKGSVVKVERGGGGAHKKVNFAIFDLECLSMSWVETGWTIHSGRLGVDTDQSDVGLLKPKGKVFSGKSRIPISEEIINLARSQYNVESVGDPVSWGFDISRVI